MNDKCDVAECELARDYFSRKVAVLCTRYKILGKGRIDCDAEKSVSVGCIIFFLGGLAERAIALASKASGG